MRNYYIAGNWKMNKTATEAREVASNMAVDLKGSKNKLMIAPPFTALSAVAEALAGSNIILGAQNMAAEVSGAHTGEISVLMLKDACVQAVIIGHSERRLIYGETDELINRKVKLALDHGLEVILCVGETLEQREAGLVDKVVKEQVLAGFEGIDVAEAKRITVAYEPVWAIGTGKTATPEDAEAVHAMIRRTAGELYSGAYADELIIQYGGSVKPDNVKGLMAMEDIDGALVGGASLETESFEPIAKFNS
ncbi:MAG: triose-phosphate isomerase [Spirochaetia bacterium]